MLFACESMLLSGIASAGVGSAFGALLGGGVVCWYERHCRGRRAKVLSRSYCEAYRSDVETGIMLINSKISGTGNGTILPSAAWNNYQLDGDMIYHILTHIKKDKSYKSFPVDTFLVRLKDYFEHIVVRINTSNVSVADLNVLLCASTGVKDMLDKIIGDLK